MPGCKILVPTNKTFSWCESQTLIVALPVTFLNFFDTFAVQCGLGAGGGVKIFLFFASVISKEDLNLNYEAPNGHFSYGVNYFNVWCLQSRLFTPRRKSVHKTAVSLSVTKFVSIELPRSSISVGATHWDGDRQQKSVHRTAKVCSSGGFGQPRMKSVHKTA